MSTNKLELDEINAAIAELEQRIDDLQIRLEKLDEFKDGDAYYAIDVQIRALQRTTQGARQQVGRPRRTGIKVCRRRIACCCKRRSPRVRRTSPYGSRVRPAGMS